MAESRSLTVPFPCLCILDNLINILGSLVFEEIIANLYASSSSPIALRINNKPINSLIAIMLLLLTLNFDQKIA